MRTIKGLFLRAKHWQLFLLLMGLFAVTVVVEVAVMTAEISSNGKVGVAGLLWGASMALNILFLGGWFWASGTFLNSISQPLLRPKTGFFRFAVIYPVLYVFIATPFFLSPGTYMVAVILPLHFFAMFCIFYDLYFVSKSLVTAETCRPTTFYDYAGPFFLIWFFPIGIWMVQPRVNRLYADSKNAQSSIQAATLA